MKKRSKAKKILYICLGVVAVAVVGLLVYVGVKAGQNDIGYFEQFKQLFSKATDTPVKDSADAVARIFIR